MLGTSAWLWSPAANAEKVNYPKADKLVAAHECAAAEREYSKAVTLPSAATDEQKWARGEALRGLARIPICFAQRDSQSACAALARFHSALGRSALDEDARARLAPLETVCGAKPAPFVPKARVTPRSASPQRDSTWVPLLAGGSGALIVAGVAAYARGATLDEPTGRRSTDFFGGARSAYEGAGATLLLAGGLLGAAAGALWYFGDDDTEASGTTARLSVHPRGVGFGGTF